jgi:hypothetical protein
MTAQIDDQTEFTSEELLASHDYVEPLFAGGRRCHGGYTADGTYVSPRTKNRVRAIEAWQRKHHEQFGTALLDVPLDRWPEPYPNVAQSRHLIEHGVIQPVVATLSRIGTVEGFGWTIRNWVVPDLPNLFDEELDGTATSHLKRGLHEAHARDESGYEDEAGHDEMWFAARDIAFENPVTEDETRRMLERLGVISPGASQPDLAAMRAAAMANRVLPDDIDFDLESLIERMTRLLLIEISAFHLFAWAEELLSDDDLVAGDGEAAKIVTYIRGDETPHVGYLQTTLSEMRDRTFVGESGRKHSGTDMVGRVWDRALTDSLGDRRFGQMTLTLREVERAIGDRPGHQDVLERYHELGSVRPDADGRWVDNPMDNAAALSEGSAATS